MQKQVEGYGGMLNKYEFLIHHLTSYPNAIIQKVQKDKIQIYIDLSIIISTMNFYIKEGFQCVNIQWIGISKKLGKHKKSWKFPDTYSQEKMVQRINEDLNNQMDKILGNKY